MTFYDEKVIKAVFYLPCITWFFSNTSHLILRFASQMAWLGIIFLYEFFPNSYAAA